MADDLLYRQIVGGAHLAGAVLAWALAALVYRARPGARPNQLLAALLYLEGGFQGIMAAFTMVGPPESSVEPTAPSRADALFPIALVFMFGASLLYLLFLATIDTPMTRPFRRSSYRRGFLALAVVHGLIAGHAFFYLARNDADVVTIQMGVLFLLTLLLMLFASVYGLVACVSAWRRAKAGTESRRRALAFMLAFGGRDGAILLHILGGPILGNMLFSGATVQTTFMNVWGIVVQSLLGIASIVFASFLAYGFLRGQLFDIDLKIKLGIRRGTVVGLILGAFFAGAKITEAYLSREVGFVAGSIIAGLMLFLVPKLNKIGDKVANVAMPQVQPTNAYLSFKKLEVYRAALESAYETGGVSEKERATLDRLREKLGLTKADTDAVEMEVRPAGASSPSAAPA